MSLLSPLDLLSLDDHEQDIVRCLTQQPGLTLDQITTATRLAPPDVEATLLRMVRTSRLVEQLQAGQRTFAVRFAPSRKRMRNAAPALLGLFEEALTSFLASTTLASALSDAERDGLARLATRRTLFPGEVYLWQSNLFEQIGVVRLGLLKRSRVQGDQRAEQTVDYIQRSEWFGLTEALGNVPSTATCSAVTETELVLWPVARLLEFIGQHAHLSLAINRWISQQLHRCREQQEQANLWVVEGVRSGVGATTLARNLARLGVQGQRANGEAQGKVLLWEPYSTRLEQRAAEHGAENFLAVLEQLLEPQADGYDQLRGTGDGNYPPQVQLDVLLTHLQSRYALVVCDSGVHNNDELTLRLRGRATNLLTVTDDPEGTALLLNRWNASRPYALPGQKRLAVLNRWQPEDAALDPAFQLALPADAATVSQATEQGCLVADIADSALGQAMHEVYRRLSLTHTVGIFIPSTLDVNQPFDNTTQVQETLAFLGTMFGGATRNEAEGVWRSEQSGLVVEQVTIVRSFVSEQALRQHLDQVVTFVGRLKQAMQQEAIAIDVDNQLVLV